MKTILVTGANGFVGNHLVKELSVHGMKVIGVGGRQGTKELGSHTDSYLVLDLNDPTDVKKIDFEAVDAVIHLAGLAAVGPSFNAPMEYLNTNLGIQVNLFEEAIKQGFKPRFLIISSGALYDPHADMPLSETSGVLPNSPYAVSKLGQEQMGTYYHSRGFECVIARPFNHIGPGQGPGFLLPDLVSQVFETKNSAINSIKVGNLDAKRDYTDVRDIVRAYRLLIEKGRSGEIYNVCSGEPRSGHEMLKELLSTVGVSPEIVEDPSLFRPTDAPILYGSYDKLTNDTDWRPEIDLQTTIKDVVSAWPSKN